MTAPMTAVTIEPIMPPHATPNQLRTLPPMKPPIRPMIMFHNKPPLLLGTMKPASQPATAPISNVIIISIIVNN